MKYRLLIYRSDAEYVKMNPDQRKALSGEYGVFTQSIIQSGHFKAGDGLQPVSTATTVRVRDGKTLTTDGPFAEHAFEMRPKLEMVDDAVGKDVGLAGGDEQPVAGLAERRQHLADPVIDPVFVQTDIGKALAVQRHGAVGEILAAEKFHKAGAQRRADAPGQFVRGRHGRMIELLQRILDRPGDAGLRVRQRSVEVEKDGVHGRLISAL